MHVLKAMGPVGFPYAFIAVFVRYAGEQAE